ncbi:hypothetical protein SAMN02745164_00567 [Marinitoga hydrogenitolerans DSM 16785]|uniref:Uncharacterized protein n=1 Tax=Marinitoga hydrogenitolerans (strain DSM 16785 / JCM 12826 / AT1271) TaxID=1122195 RepID=A0A1M4TZI3_MARH1|nr:hypothetical protein [Marinitoga hydrogenitolerans]SHE49895.1 hypothetical protein SAMN02745164_00567 [Marinitoga hydrogenitolerans DSM 16785]
MKKGFFIFLIIIPISIFSLNLGIYSNGIFLEFPAENLTVKAGYPTFGISYRGGDNYFNYNIVTDFNLNNPQLNNYISSNIAIKLQNANIYSGFWNVFDTNNSTESTSTINIGNMGFFTGISTTINNFKINISMNIKILNWIKTGDIITNLPSFKGTFEDAVSLNIGLNYLIPIKDNKVVLFFNFGANYISFPNGLTLYQFKNNYNFGVLLTLNELFKQEE